MWRIHFDIRQNQYNIVKLKNKIKLKLVHVKKILLKKCRSIYLLPQGILVTWFVVVVQSLTVSDSLPPRELQHARFLCPSLFPRVSSNSYPLSRWCHPTVSFSVVPFSSCPHSFPASGSLPMSQFFTSGGQSIGVSALASVLPMNIQDWFPLGLTGLISLQSKGLSRVFFNTTIQKHQFYGAQLSLWFNSHIHTWLLERS